MIPSDLELPAKFTAFRPGQDDSAVELLCNDRRFAFLAAPTGTGKSLIYMALSQLMEPGSRTLVLVGTKGLQRQLTDDFEAMGMADVRGHANYPCGIPAYDDDGQYAGIQCSAKKDACQHYRAVERAQRSSIVVTNYAFWMATRRYTDPTALGRFDLLVMDEAHGVPDWLAGFCTVTVDRQAISVLLGMNLPEPDKETSEWREWVTIALSKVGQVNNPEQKKRLRADLKVLEAADLDEWIREKTGRGVRLSPIWAHTFSERYLFCGIPRVVLSSATLSPTIAKYLGIPKDEMLYLEATAGFDPKRRPFIYVPTIRVDWRMNEGQTRIWMNRIDSIIEGRADRKGIIHTRSFRRAREILKRSKHRDIMIGHKPGEVQTAVERYKAHAAPCVLVSPSVEEGFDFPGDTCRYQIIVKVPFVDGRKGLVKARSERDDGYLNYVAALSLVQMVGRCMRSADDAGETLIIDDHWAWFQKRAEFPPWFRRTWRKSAKVPAPLNIERVA